MTDGVSIDGLTKIYCKYQSKNKDYLVFKNNCSIFCQLFSITKVSPFFIIRKIICYYYFNICCNFLTQIIKFFYGFGVDKNSVDKSGGALLLKYYSAYNSFSN